MAREKGLGPVKRFGARYGATTKHRLAKIEKEQKKPQLCPYCNKPKAKRVSYGIYECSKCQNKFTGRAYTVGRTRKNSESFLRAEKPGFSSEAKTYEVSPEETKEEVKEE